MKKLLRSIIRYLGFEAVHYSSDPILISFLKTYNELRLKSTNSQDWTLNLSRLSSLCYLRQTLQNNNIDLLIDVGANRGQFALEARRLGYKGEIISFEPISANNIFLNRLASQDNKWKICPYALGSERKELVLNIYNDDSFSSFYEINEVAKQSFGSLVNLDRTENVQIYTMDEVATSLGITKDRRIFLKTDTQGHDSEVIIGAKQTLNYVIGILTEATITSLYNSSSTLEDLIGLLLPMGFSHGGMFPISYIIDTLKLIELDCYFTRQI